VAQPGRRPAAVPRRRPDRPGHGAETLLRVRGIGSFTAHALLLRALGRPDDTPLEMAQFSHAASAVYGPEPPSPTQLRQRYGRHVGWWAYFSRTGLGWLDRAGTPAMAAA
jgi:3-methyladenine DNA glycosylase/8-oxoguanine DNA glycosylase